MESPICTVFANAKGGVGRTTLTVNIADRLTARGRSVLVVDATDQDAVRTALGADHENRPEADLAGVVTGETPIEDAVIPVDDIDVLPGLGNGDAARQALAGGVDSLTRFARFVVAPARDRYDHVLVDAAPEITPLSDATLVAADQVVMPTGLNHADLSGLARTIERQIVPIRRERVLPIAAIVPNRLRGTAEERRSLAAVSATSLGDRLIRDDGELLAIRERTAIQESWAEGIPYARYDPSGEMVDRFDRLGTAVLGGTAHA